MAPIDWDPTELQTAIQAWLDRTGMSQKEAALVIGVSQSVLNRWMHRDRVYLVQPKPPSLERLSPKIGIPYDELMRMAGYRGSGTVKLDPADLDELFRAMRSSAATIDDQHERAARIRATMSLWPEAQHRRRPNRRISKGDEGLDHSKNHYRMHKYAA